MFDIDSGKLLIVAVLALIVIGPKELPRVMRQVGQAIGKMRRMASEFQGQFMDAMKEADIADIRKELDELNKSAALDVHFDPARDIQAELSGVMSSTPAGPAPASVASGIAAFPADDPASPGHFGLSEVSASPQDAPLLQGLASPDETTSAKAGIAADLNNGMPATPPTIATDGHEPSEPMIPAKRKIIVKRRRSVFHVVREDGADGALPAVRRRAVRAKPVDLSEMQPS